MKLRTVIINSGSKGGSGKTTALVAFLSSLMRMGYRLRLIDADTSNRTLSAIYPDETTNGDLTQVNLDIEGDFQKAIEKCALLDEDIITVIDMPGSKSQFFVDFFGNKTPEDFEKIGIRLIIAVTVCNTAQAFKGIREILRIFMSNYPVIALKNDVANLKNTKFDLNMNTTGKALLAAAKDRVIEIPQMAGLQRQEYDRYPAPPSSYLNGERAASKLGLTHLSSMEWVEFGNKVLAQTQPYAEWITGMPIPTPSREAPKISKASSKLLDAMDDDDL